MKLTLILIFAFYSLLWVIVLFAVWMVVIRYGKGVIDEAKNRIKDLESVDKANEEWFVRRDAYTYSHELDYNESEAEKIQPHYRHSRHQFMRADIRRTRYIRKNGKERKE